MKTTKTILKRCSKFSNWLSAYIQNGSELNDDKVAAIDQLLISILNGSYVIIPREITNNYVKPKRWRCPKGENPVHEEYL